MQGKATFFTLIALSMFGNPALAGNGDNAKSSFFSAEYWKLRVGLTAFQVEDSVTFGIGFGAKGNYTTAGGTRLELLATAIVEDDRDELDSDHIPVWFKNRFKAEKQIAAFTPSWLLDVTLDLDHKMNTVSSIEQSATLVPGIKLGFNTRRLVFFAKLGAGGYYLEIDDDLPEEYADYRREDLANSEFALAQEYKFELPLNDVLSFSYRYKDFRDTNWELLESRKKMKLTYTADLRRKFVLDIEKTHYNLDQFSRSAGENGLAVLPFNEDTYYQAYLEFDF